MNNTLLIVYFVSLCVPRLVRSDSSLYVLRPPPLYAVYFVIVYSNENRFCVEQILGIHSPCLPAAVVVDAVLLSPDRVVTGLCQFKIYLGFFFFFLVQRL